MTPPAGSSAATMLGLLAVVFWSSTVAFSRGLTENLGVFTAACAIYLGGGALGCVALLARPARRRRLAQASARYWLVCGGSFIVNIVCFHLAVGLAHGRQGIIGVGLVNYLWISLTLLLSVPILGKRPRWGLLPGMIIACAGVVLATIHDGPLDLAEFAANARENAVPCILAFMGALAWAVYSNFNRRWEAESGGGPTPVFLAAAGVIFLAMRPCVNETAAWNAPVLAGLAATILFPTILAYAFWDAAMRRGNIVLVVSVSYLTPVLSTLINCFYCGILPGPKLWLACFLVVAGAAQCRRSISDDG
ncbi:MAG TPA: aromatic amino acid DMT transporter YddG [Candidatus Hydrogenedentes bacterium]|nr:aromatic amino acid DMT transporter YddG [Candidatus Hydrogenedentota bacterium]HPC18507.1 aromatic amino acid DMT transporter YddG [Candidatus Hydrogenedentota bacterium]HRT18827.1 aromatic amino acid DMT transporter YddG [Candidatus Hydrogenedentota bacterium]HRT65552.1 aromatic amino acid DMT transporter YddG [Candidatus Hydrogenedentota bacterium]